MKVEHEQNSFKITYSDEEWDFINTLDDISKRYIIMGITTPYDYGYKAKNK